MLRHGRTAWNTERRVQGHLDVPLDEVGRDQAAAVAPALAAMQPAFVRSSDLCRARETAEAVAAAVGLEVCLDHRLREFDMGDLSGRTMGDYARSHPDDHALLVSGDYGRVPAGESVEQLTARFLPALEDAFARVPDGGLGIVVTHGAAARVSLVAWLGLPPTTAGVLGSIGNCHWALLEVDEGPGTPEGPGAPGPDLRRRLVAYNRRA